MTNKKIHILGIGGTFMAGVATLAKALGFTVSGSDLAIYPPMSTQLEALGVTLFQGYSAENLSHQPDYLVVGNAIKRGNPELEAILDQGLPYSSGPQWLAEEVLNGCHVIAVSGTHGKTTTTSLLTWILHYAGKNPGFLIGGVPENFGVCAALPTQVKVNDAEKPYFVIEADEYDSAFSDKRSKFIHYKPRTLILNNLEFDHADIFSDLNQIKKQFHHLIRTIPSTGLIIKNAKDKNLSDVIELGAWTPVINFGDSSGLNAQLIEQDGSRFALYEQKQWIADVEWPLIGQHNVMNALAAITAASAIGIPIKTAIAALANFKNVKRRLEHKGEYHGVTVYDDFAHHPTAIEQTLMSLRKHIGNRRLLAVLEFGSYTMRSGSHPPEAFVNALSAADHVFLREPKDQISYANEVARLLLSPATISADTQALAKKVAEETKPNDVVLVMSNTGFDGFFNTLTDLL